MTAPPNPTHLVAPAKLTLSLRVTGRRPDGMHLVDAVMVSVDLCDELWIGPGNGCDLEGPESEGLRADGDTLVAAALALAGRRAHVRVLKRIPAGAGLGGGSADAAAVLRWAGVSDPVAAAAIGADVAFCLTGGRARVSGIGERIEPLEFVEQTFTLFTPKLHCSTPAVYAAWDRLGGPHHQSGNDLTDAALAVVPELAAAREQFWATTGVEPRLAGSGSTWFVEGAHPGPGHRVVHTVPSEWCPTI